LEAFQSAIDFQQQQLLSVSGSSSKNTYMWRDIERRAASYEIPIRVPAPYPSKNSSFTTRIALVGSQEGWVKEFALAAYRRWLQLGEGVRAGGVVKDAALPG
jgi:2-hydroxychromene-2-carboxylate isomerase